MCNIMDYDSSTDSCNSSVLPGVQRPQPHPPEWEEFTHYRITTLPAEPIQYINDLHEKLEVKASEIFFINLENFRLEQRTRSLKDRISQLEAQVEEKTKEFEDHRSGCIMADYQRISQAIEVLKTEAITRYQEFLDLKVKKIMGGDVIMDGCPC